MTVIARIEQHGNVAFTEGKRVLRVPSENACRERLIKLLESAGGDRQHPAVIDFWQERSRDLGSDDELKAACAVETFQRLERIWDELITPPVAPPGAVDVFATFGV